MEIPQKSTSQKIISQKITYEERRILLDETIHSKYMVLILLLGSTFLLLLWILLAEIAISSQSKFDAGYIYSFGKIFFLFIMAINAFSWATWAMPSSLTTKNDWERSINKRNQSSKRFRDIESYEEALYTLYRQKRIERIIGLFTAAEFILLTMYLMFTYIGL